MASILVTLETDAEDAIDWLKTELSAAAKDALSIVVSDSTAALKTLKSSTSLGTDIANLVSGASAAAGGSVPAVESLFEEAEKIYADFETGGGLVGIWEAGVSLAKALLTDIYNDFVTAIPKTL